MADAHTTNGQPTAAKSTGAHKDGAHENGNAAPSARTDPQPPHPPTPPHSSHPYPKARPDHLGPDAPAGKAWRLTSAPETEAANIEANPVVSEKYGLPLIGGLNPGSRREGTTPGSFARAPDVGGALMYASPDAPGMPAPSTKTAWDFLPDGWTVEALDPGEVSPVLRAKDTALRER